jgi:hypothetical protein
MENVLTDESMWHSVIEEFTLTDLYFGEVNYDFFGIHMLIIPNII